MRRKKPAPGRRAPLFADTTNESRAAGLVIRPAPSDVGDIATGNADIGKFAVAKLRKFLNRNRITLPIPVAAENG